jgi:hypothetical protein
MKFITRKDCHLCEEAWLIVAEVAKRSGVDVEIVDVDLAAELVGEYRDRVPVVIGPSGTVLAEGRMDLKSLRRAVRRLSK